MVHLIDASEADGIHIFLNGPFQAYFSLFPSFLQTVNRISWLHKSCRLLDSNCGPLVSEAIDLPIEQQQLLYINERVE